MDFENKEAIHNTRIAPTVEVIKLPINPEAASPKRANYYKTKTSAAHNFACKESGHNTNNNIPNKAHIILLFYLTTAGVANGSVSQK